MGLERIIRKDLKKWARLSYQGKPLKVAFYKCKLVSNALNYKYKKKELKHKTFNELLVALEDIKKECEYTSYETKFLNEYCEWYAKTFTLK